MEIYIGHVGVLRSASYLSLMTHYPRCSESTFSVIPCFEGVWKQRSFSVATGLMELYVQAIDNFNPVNLLCKYTITKL